MDIFRIENSIADLDEQVDRRYGPLLFPLFHGETEFSCYATVNQRALIRSFPPTRKQQVTSGQSELEALEARIKEMEERLKRQNPPGAAGSMSPRAQRQAISDAFGPAAAAATTSADKDQQQQRSRPGTAKQVQQAPAHGGAMPPTPTASEGEYVLVNHSSSGDGRADVRKFTDHVFVSKDGGDREN